MNRLFLALTLCLFMPLTAYGQGCDSDTQYLCHFDCAEGDADATDENCDSSGAHVMTWQSTAQCDSGKTKFDNTVIFDGGDDRITIPDSTDFDVYADDGDWTVDFWVNSTNATEDYGLWIEHTPTGGGEYWFMQANNHHVRFYVGSDTPAFTSSCVGTTDITDNAWHHVSWTRLDNDAAVYADGAQECYVSQSGKRAFRGGQLTIGSDRAAGNSWDGNMEEIRIQNSNYFSLTAGANNGSMDTSGPPWNGSFTPPTAAYSTVGGAARRIILITKFIKRKSSGYDRIQYSQNFGWNGIKERGYF